jgi:Ca-activated chloride channel homolog
MNFASPLFLWLLALIPLVILGLWWNKHRRRHASLVFSETADFENLPGNWRAYGHFGIIAIWTIALILIIVALARPQRLNETITRNVEGIDIVITFDMSTSMLAEDLRPNRFVAAKNLTAEFIDARRNDRIGLVIFARQSFTLVPPTTDYRLLKQQLFDLRMGMTEDGTAIGMGLATAVNRLRNSTATSRVIVLLTDGENNAGEIDPITAADLAAANGIRLYTIGVSTEGTAPYPVDDPIFGRRYHPIKVDIDEPMLTQMAERTGGKYFRARDTESLSRIYSEIDALETSRIDETIYQDRTDYYMHFLLLAVILVFLAASGERFFFRTELV